MTSPSSAPATRTIVVKVPSALSMKKKVIQDRMPILVPTIYGRWITDRRPLLLSAISAWRRVAIGVVSQCELEKRILDGLLIGVSGNAENLLVITLLGHHRGSLGSYAGVP